MLANGRGARTDDIRSISCTSLKDVEYLIFRKIQVQKDSIINDNEQPITLLVDASGLNVSKKRDYIEEK